MASRASFGEFELIEAIAELVAGPTKRRRSGRARGVILGIGDDAAVVDTPGPTLLTTDVLTDGVHFRDGWLSPSDLGRRAVRVAASDVAAMGGAARYVLLGLGVPERLTRADARALAAGVVEETADAGATLVGGNVSAAPGLTVAVTVVGEPVADPIRRDSARPGDTIVVTGALGGAAAGVELLERGVRRGGLVDAYRRPPRRLDVAAALARARVATAMIDVSDGLAQDLGHVCRLSGVAAQLDVGALPAHPALARATRGKARRLARDAGHYALAGGEDYELLFTVNGPRALSRAVRLCKSRGCELTRIGRILPCDDRFALRDHDGRPIAEAGFTHLGGRRR